MGGFFDYDGPLMTFLSRITSLMGLGLLTLLFCVPVVTAGASITAMYYAAFQLRDHDKGHVWNNFWHSFKSNFWQSTFLWLLMIAGFSIFYADIVILTRGTDTYPAVFKIVTGLAAFAYALTCTFVFPLQARFHSKWKQVLKNSFLMGLVHLPKTILMVLTHIVPFALLFFFPVLFPVVLMLGFSAPAYFNAATLLKIFQRYALAEKAPAESAAQTADEA